MSTETIPTPRTDAAKRMLSRHEECIPADFARALERELFVAEEALKKNRDDGFAPWDVAAEALHRLASMRAQKGEGK